MHDQLMLTDAEWQLVVELLEREQRELPPEIHHTRTSSVRTELHERLETVQRLLQKMRTPAVA